MDSYISSLGHQLCFLDHDNELHRSYREAKGKCPVLVGLVLEIKPQEFLGLSVNGNVEIGVAEIQRCHPFPLLQRDPDGLWGFHFGMFLQLQFCSEN